MSKSQTAAVALLITLVLAGLMLFKPPAQAATPKADQPGLTKHRTQNKFSKRWTSYITSATGEKVEEGVIEISDAGGPNSSEVIVQHSGYSGLYPAFTTAEPDQIEIQIPLGDGRVAHYNGVLVSSTEIQGHFFITETAQRLSHHGHTRRSIEEDNWTAKGND